MCAFLLGWMNRCFFCCIHCFQYRQQRRRNRRALQQWRTLQDQFDTVANMHVPHQPSQPDGSIQNNEDNGSNEVMLDANTIVEELFVQALLFRFMSHERVRHNDQIIPANTELHHGDGDDEESMYQLNNSSSRSSPNIEMVTRNSERQLIFIYLAMICNRIRRDDERYQNFFFIMKLPINPTKLYAQNFQSMISSQLLLMKADIVLTNSMNLKKKTNKKNEYGLCFIEI